MRPRRCSTPAFSGAASGTCVSRSGENTSCTREIGKPKSWPPMVAVTYSMTFSVAVIVPSCGTAHVCPAHVGGLLLERRNQALAIELGNVVVETDLPSARDRVGGNKRG